MILKSFCDGDLSVKLELSIDFDEEEIRLEVTRTDVVSGTGEGISFDASEFGDALKYFNACVNGDDDVISSFDASFDFGEALEHFNSCANHHLENEKNV